MALFANYQQIEVNLHVQIDNKLKTVKYIKLHETKTNTTYKSHLPSRFKAALKNKTNRFQANTILRQCCSDAVPCLQRGSCLNCHNAARSMITTHENRVIINKRRKTPHHNQDMTSRCEDMITQCPGGTTGNSKPRVECLVQGLVIFLRFFALFLNPVLTPHSLISFIHLYDFKS